MAELPIRRYRSADEDRVLELHEEALRDVDAYVEGVSDPDLEDIEGEYLGSGGEFLVGRLRGRIVAMGAFRPVAERTASAFDSLARPAAEVKRMRVDPDHQRRGFGGAVYDELEARARKGGYRELVLDTRPHQTGARRFFEAKGFKEERRVTVEAFEEPFDLLYYRKPLER